MTEAAYEIALVRAGQIRRPFYHVIVRGCDAASGEKLGVYNPMLPVDHPYRLVLRSHRLAKWLDMGVHMDEDVARVVVHKGH
jgi:small subunit ribosomal protein S16